MSSQTWSGWLKINPWGHRSSVTDGLAESSPKQHWTKAFCAWVEGIRLTSWLHFSDVVIEPILQLMQHSVIVVRSSWQISPLSSSSLLSFDGKTLFFHSVVIWRKNFVFLFCCHLTEKLCFFLSCRHLTEKLCFLSGDPGTLSRWSPSCFRNHRSISVFASCDRACPCLVGTHSHCRTLGCDGLQSRPMFLNGSIPHHAYLPSQLCCRLQTILHHTRQRLQEHYGAIGFCFSTLTQHRYVLARGKSLLESWGTTFLPDWQPPLIFVWFTSKSHEH